MHKIIFLSFIVCVLFVVTTFFLVDFFQDILPKQPAYAESTYFHHTNLWDMSSLKEYMKNKIGWDSNRSDDIVQN
ncbi:MAG: hypothetical protein JXD21_08985 [Candidatus Omnitrophica bacterium]|nr:hypothetical protein [Candidatus Omnitrophota bacterium]